MTRAIYRLIKIFALVMFPSVANAQCLPVIQADGGLYENVSGGYDAFVPGNGVRAVRISVSNQGGDVCRLTFTNPDSTDGSIRLAGPGSAIDAKLFFDRGLQQPITNRPSISASLWTMEVASGEETSGEIFITVPSGQFVPPGAYVDRVLLDAIDVDDLHEVEEVPLLVQTLVLSRAQLSFDAASFSSSTSHTKILDFGELVSGATRDLRFFVRANGEYGLEIESENAGALVRELGTGTAAERIDYTMRLNGRPILTSGSAGSRDAQWLRRGDIGNQGNHLLFTIGDVANKQAGTYSDTVYIRVDGLN